MKQMISKMLSLDSFNIITLNITRKFFSRTEIFFYCDFFFGLSAVSGVMYVAIHSASNVLISDRGGASDPYCVLFCDRSRVGPGCLI